GQLPLAAPLRLGRGPVELELSAPGHVTARRTLTISGEPQSVTISLEREGARPAGGAPKEPAPAGPSPTGPAPPPPRRDAPEGSPEPAASTGPLRLFAWGTGALALAAIATGVFETVRWQSGVTDFNNHKGASGQIDCLTAQADRGGPACKS